MPNWSDLWKNIEVAIENDTNRKAADLELRYIEIAKRVERLAAENEQLRQALERINNESIDCYAREIAEQMLAHGR